MRLYMLLSMFLLLVLLVIAACFCVKREGFNAYKPIPIPPCTVWKNSINWNSCFDYAIDVDDRNRYLACKQAAATEKDEKTIQYHIVRGLKGLPVPVPGTGPTVPVPGTGPTVPVPGTGPTVPVPGTGPTVPAPSWNTQNVCTYTCDAFKPIYPITGYDHTGKMKVCCATEGTSVQIEHFSVNTTEPYKIGFNLQFKGAWRYDVYLLHPNGSEIRLKWNDFKGPVNVEMEVFIGNLNGYNSLTKTASNRIGQVRNNTISAGTYELKVVMNNDESKSLTSSSFNLDTPSALPSRDSICGDFGKIVESPPGYKHEMMLAICKNIVNGSLQNAYPAIVNQFNAYFQNAATKEDQYLGFQVQINGHTRFDLYITLKSDPYKSIRMKYVNHYTPTDKAYHIKIYNFHRYKSMVMTKTDTGYVYQPDTVSDIGPGRYTAQLLFTDKVIKNESNVLKPYAVDVDIYIKDPDINIKDQVDSNDPAQQNRGM